MSRRFESADPSRRGPRRPPAASSRAAAQRAAQAEASNDRIRQSSAGAAPFASAAASPAASSRVATPRSVAVTPEPAGTSQSGPQSQQNSQSGQQSAGLPPPMQEFASKMCTEQDVQDARYHILKFRSQTTVDPAQDFVPPIRMHRKDPKQSQVLASEEQDEDSMDVDVKSEGVKSENGGKAEAEPGDHHLDSNKGTTASNGNGNVGGSSNGNGANGANGTGKDEQRPKKRPFQRKRKTHQVHGGEKNEAARKSRYEEHYPWIMEDFDNKNTWISSYEAAQSNNYAISTYDASSNGFKLIPIEKVYKMTPATRYATSSLEDAEKKMESKHTMRDRWMMSHLQPRANGVRSPGESPMADQLHGHSGPGGSGGYNPYASGKSRTVVGSEERKHRYTLDEEMDFDDQESFDDDEGAPISDGPEEDLKEAEDRIKQEQLKANELMDADREGDMDDLFEDTQSREGKQGKKVRKASRSLEKNQYYDTDEEENPYATTESEDSADELENQVVVKQEEGLNPDESQHDAAQAAAEAEASSMLVSQFRRKAINRDSSPHGTVVSQSPPSISSRFGAGEWNPSARRSTSETPVEADPTSLTRDYVRRNIKSGETDLRQLLAASKPKLAENPENRKSSKTYIKEVARHRDGKLISRN